VLHRYRAHHAGASLERLYLSWNSGGQGLVNLCNAWEREVMSSALYLARAASEDELMRAVVEHHSHLRERGEYSIVKLAIRTLQKYGVAEGDMIESIEEGTGLPRLSQVVDKL